MANKIDIEKVKILFEKGDIDSQIEASLVINKWLVGKVNQDKKASDERLLKLGGN